MFTDLPEAQEVLMWQLEARAKQQQQQQERSFPANPISAGPAGMGLAWSTSMQARPPLCPVIGG